MHIPDRKKSHNLPTDVFFHKHNLFLPDAVQFAENILPAPLYTPDPKHSVHPIRTDGKIFHQPPAVSSETWHKVPQNVHCAHRYDAFQCLLQYVHVVVFQTDSTALHRKNLRQSVSTDKYVTEQTAPVRYSQESRFHLQFRSCVAPFLPLHLPHKMPEYQGGSILLRSELPPIHMPAPSLPA